jgi:hypothetical protein
MIYIENNIWNDIKSYIFHDIQKHSQHLKNDINILLFNNVMKDLNSAFTGIFYSMIHYSKSNILKEIDVYEINEGKYKIITSYSIASMYEVFNYFKNKDDNNLFYTKYV